MSPKNPYLKNIHIQNYLSLRDIKLPLSPLTVFVGPNASGKSNVLEALDLLREMVRNEEPPPAKYIQDRLWAGGAKHISFKFEIDLFNINTSYSLKIKPDLVNSIDKETLTVGNIEVLLIKNGNGVVRDEDNQNEIRYHSKKLALNSAGNYGHKPVTNHLKHFIEDWEFYDFKPDQIREGTEIRFVNNVIEAAYTAPSDFLYDKGNNLKSVLLNWARNKPLLFDTINKEFELHSKFKIKAGEGERELNFYEGYSNPIPINKISDGTLRLLAYLVLVNQPELPPLVAIEEPERNLHPAWLSSLGDILNRLAERTQVLITTHSSQLLDTFSPQDLQDNLGVLLLKNIPGSGTEVVPLDKIKADRKGLENWINEFGIGSAIFDSDILQDIMESPVEV